MVTEEVMQALDKLQTALGDFIFLVGLEYTDDDEYICNNRGQVDEDWCDEEMLASIDQAFVDISFFLGR